MEKEYIAVVSCITLVVSLKTLCEKLQEDSPRENKFTTLSSGHLQSSRLSYVIFQEPEQGLAIKELLPLNHARLSH